MYTYVVLPTVGSLSSLKACRFAATLHDGQLIFYSQNRSTNPMVLLQVSERYPPVLSLSLVMNHEFIIIKVLFSDLPL